LTEGKVAVRNWNHWPTNIC